MIRRVKVAIIGAGTAGLTALKTVSRFTDDFVVIDPGPGGTMSARSGCMPSKALITAAHEYHKRHFLPELGISHAHNLHIESREVMKRIRQLRERFSQGPVRAIEKLGQRFICDAACFESAEQIRVGNTLIQAEKIIVATGSSPEIPDEWAALSGVLTTDQLFDLEKLPTSLAVIGLGSAGLEIAQALSRLGVQVVAFEQRDWLGGIYDPDIQYWAREYFSSEYRICSGQNVCVNTEAGGYSVSSGKERYRVEKVLVTGGRRTALSAMNFAATGLPMRNGGVPIFDPETLQVEGSGIFIAGDAGQEDMKMHHAADEGRIAGFNAADPDGVKRYQRRVPLSITFTDPQVARFGLRYDQLNLSETAIGSADFGFQNRALIMGEHRGLVRLYADRVSRKLTGGEMLVPRAEHFAFELATCIHNGMTVDEMAWLPFYHPTMEEGLRSALYNLGEELGGVLPEHFLPVI